MQSLDIFIIAIIIGLLLFLHGNFKKIIDLLTEISSILNKISKQNLIEKNSDNDENYWRCIKCFRKNPNTVFICENCGYRLK